MRAKGRRREKAYSMYTEKMGSVWRTGRPSCVGAKLWLNGSDPVKPPWLTWPPCWRDPHLVPQSWRTTDLLSMLITGENWTVLQSRSAARTAAHPADPSVRGRWISAPWLTDGNRLSQNLSPSPACACTPRLPCRGVLWAPKYAHGETAVLTFCGKGGGRRTGALTNVWCMPLWRQQQSESSGLSVTDNPHKRRTPQHFTRA